MEGNLNYLVIIAIVIATVVSLRIKAKREAKRNEGLQTDLSISLENIPPKLRGLAPLLYKWCIPDDVEREKLTSKLSKKQKRF